ERFIVKFDDNHVAAKSGAAPMDAVVHAANRALLGMGMAKAGGAPAELPATASYLRPMSMGAEVLGVSRKLDRAAAEAVLSEIAKLPGIESVQVDWLLKAHFVPNDPFLYGYQWGFYLPGVSINAEQAWDVADGSGIRVAVLDTGIVNHSDLNANIVAGYDFISSAAISNDGDGRDADPSDPGDWEVATGDPSSWHGTHVAGTIAAVTNNAKGVAGTAFNARVIPVRVLGTGGGSFIDIIDAITWSSGGSVPGVPDLATGDVADVINMSLGGLAPCFGILQDAVDGAVSRGTTVVVSAGNDNLDVVNATPANCANVVSVASSDFYGARSGFSNYGAGIEITAPGTQIASTWIASTTVPGPETYAYMSGTSMAAPHVAGAIALAQSRRLELGLPLWTPGEVTSQLAATAYALTVACPEGCGPGLLDANALVQAASFVPQPTDLAVYAARPAAITYAREVSFGFSVRNRGPEAAAGTYLEMEITNRIEGLTVDAPAGWTCDEQAPTRSARVMRCDYAGNYPARQNDMITFTASSARSVQIQATGTAGSTNEDTMDRNNSASMMFRFGLGYY
ncbi:MAG TPA: S8 family peptidase, partial [Arenimonas sp.]|nr:S8 family peptidase [Arenimonas sp.]